MAEILGAPLGALAGLCAYLKWSQWPLAVGIAAAVYIVATMRFKLDAARAEGEYCREAGFDKRPPGAGRK